MEHILLLGITSLVLNFVLYHRGMYALGPETKRATHVPYWFIVGLFAFWLFIQNVLIPFILTLSLPYITTYATLAETRLSILSLSQIAYIVLASGGFYLLHRTLPRNVQCDILLRHRTLSRIGGDILFGIFLLLVALPTAHFVDVTLEYLLTLLFGETLPHQVAVQYLLNARDSLWAYGIMVFVAVLAAPILEEYLFRGVLLTYLRRFFGPTGAILLSSFIFAAFHFAFSQKLNNIPLLCSLFIFALYLGFCYEKKQSLVSSIALHIAFNATSVLQLYFFEGEL